MAMVAVLLGMRARAKPRQSSAVDASTKAASASFMGGAGRLVSRATPSGVPTAVPASRRPTERQWMSRIRPGRRWRLAAISRRKMDGMISAGG
jgi:hypothetical protein